MKIGIVQFPGSNCERETMLAVRRAEMTPIEFLWNEPLSKLQQCDGYIIVGGFSYEDRSRAGVIAALDPVLQALKAESDKGKPILGICNGAQILLEAGLVPGLENHKLGMVLTDNLRQKNGEIIGTGFYNAWVNLCLADNYQRNAFTRHLHQNSILHVPVAHAEGRFVMTEALWQEINIQGLAVFRYCDDKGNIIPDFPINPNGSMHNIAAIANKAGNVMAMMPHPERTPAGDPIFHAMRDYLASGLSSRTNTLSYYPRRTKLDTYQRIANAQEMLIESLITDNQAISVQTALARLGISVEVKRYLHWEVSSNDPNIISRLNEHGLLYNKQKEKEVTLNFDRAFLVRAKEDVLGKKKTQLVKKHFSLQVDEIKYSVIWHFLTEADNIQDVLDKVLDTNIIHNPYAHNCYEYKKL